MHPNIVIGQLVIPSWYAMVAVGAVITTILAIASKPQNFPLTRRDLLLLGALLTASGLIGARILFILIHPAGAKNGFAYFGALISFLLTLVIYSALRRINVMTLLDYVMPFLMLSQMFVRIGCLMAGCCYGKPTGKSFGVIFKTVDAISRHPTQAYEAGALFLIYIIGRRIYNKAVEIRGLTTVSALALYGAARFFIEYLRADFTSALFNLSVAQIVCFSLAVTSAVCGGLILWKR